MLRKSEKEEALAKASRRTRGYKRRKKTAEAEARPKKKENVISGRRGSCLRGRGEKSSAKLQCWEPLR